MDMIFVALACVAGICEIEGADRLRAGSDVSRDHAAAAETANDASTVDECSEPNESGRGKRVVFKTFPKSQETKRLLRNCVLMSPNKVRVGYIPPEDKESASFTQEDVDVLFASAPPARQQTPPHLREREFITADQMRAAKERVEMVTYPYGASVGASPTAFMEARKAANPSPAATPSVVDHLRQRCAQQDPEIVLKPSVDRPRPRFSGRPAGLRAALVPARFAGAAVDDKPSSIRRRSSISQQPDSPSPKQSKSSK